MERLRRSASLLLSGLQFALGYLAYLVTGRTPSWAHVAMIRSFCLTGGRSNDLVSRLIGAWHRPYAFPRHEGLLGVLDQARRERIAADLRERGFHVFEDRLPLDLCDALLAFALTGPCTTRSMDGGKPGSAVTTSYSRGAPQAVRYDFATQDLLDEPHIQAVLSDPGFATVAQDYLGGRPMMDVLSMWWHTAFSDQPDSEAAQFFHFDMDRPKWLKFFIYLTDVGTDNGPHSFIEGTQRTGGIPGPLLAKGYARISDEEAASAFPPERFREFTGLRGTVIAEDTRGLHKGKHVQQGDRLVLQVQYSNSLFGAAYPTTKFGDRLVPALRDRIARYPRIFSAYH